MADETQSRPVSIEEVLRDEAQQIHGDKLAALKIDISKCSGRELYGVLNKLDSAALCLSGGGIRSACFALGVMQALAEHPRSVKDGKVEVGKRVADENASLLGKFDYLSTVSGGGYIGSWLSAGIARTSFADMWKKLVCREPNPENEAPQITWLRAYSNYLTPTLGLTSADTWTAVALYVRNLLLNWLVIIPVVCIALLIIKLGAIGTFALGPAPNWLVLTLAAIGVLLEILALRFALLSRPTRPPRSKTTIRQDTTTQDIATKAAAETQVTSEGRAPENDAKLTEEIAAAETIARAANKGAQEANENQQAVGRGADQKRFLHRDLAPATLSAVFFMLAFVPDYSDFLLSWSAWQLAGSGLLLGMAIYAIAWIVAVPWPKRERQRDRGYWFKDFRHWTYSGAVYGAIVGLGIYLFTKDLTPLIGNIDVATPTKDTLLLLIYVVPWIILAQLTAEMIFVGLTSWQDNSDADREWFGRSSGWFAVTALAWLVVGFLVLVGAGLVYDLYTQAGAYLGKTGGGVISGIAGLLTAILGKSSKTSARKNVSGSNWRDIVLAISTVIFAIAIVVGLSALLDNLLFDYSLLNSPLIGGTGEVDDEPKHTGLEDFMWLLIGLVVAKIVGWLASKNVNVNRFSLHAMYRNRLIRAFLGATNPGRNPDRFTGFDERDNAPMTALWTEGRQLKGLYHVINIALNIVSAQRLAWQERKAESFTVSPRHCGSAYKAFRDSAEYANRISLGTAMAISGAAASPNMGYHSSPIVTFLLALLNVRLGWWLGNPGNEGKDTYNHEGPLTAVRPLFDEMFGRTTDDNPYVYLSDGGHFENLGLYEMVRRRCRLIVVSDAGCDKDFQFEDLGNAVRKISLDLGVPIRFAGLNALRDRAKRKAQYGPYEPPFHAIGTVDYAAADGAESKPGIIVYIKPCFHRNRIHNIGVRNYAVMHPEFPHESTADQFFSESQFESYRALGYEMTDAVLNQALENSNLPAEPAMEDVFKLLPQTVKAGP